MTAHTDNTIFVLFLKTRMYICKNDAYKDYYDMHQNESFAGEMMTLFPVFACLAFYNGNIILF